MEINWQVIGKNLLLRLRMRDKEQNWHPSARRVHYSITVIVLKIFIHILQVSWVITRHAAIYFMIL